MFPKRFSDLIGCALPLQLAGMGHIAGPELALAVADAGGLGMVALPAIGADRLGSVLQRLAEQTVGRVGVNFLVPFLDLDCVEVAARFAPVVEWFYGTPDAALIAMAHRQGALAGWQVGSVADGRLAADAGCDYVVVQGVEAGGHLHGDESLWSLLEQLRPTIDVPVVAAGGLGTAAAVVDAFDAGADGVRIGTRFVAAVEADAHPEYVCALVDATAADTEVTTTFGLGWPDAPHRVLRCSIERADALTADTAGTMDLGTARTPVPRFSPIPPSSDFEGSVEATALYAGMSCDAVTGAQPAAAIVSELIDGAAAIIAERS